MMLIVSRRRDKSGALASRFRDPGRFALRFPFLVAIAATAASTAAAEPDCDALRQEAWAALEARQNLTETQNRDLWYRVKNLDGDTLSLINNDRAYLVSFKITQGGLASRFNIGSDCALAYGDVTVDVGEYAPTSFSSDMTRAVEAWNPDTTGLATAAETGNAEPLADPFGGAPASNTILSARALIVAPDLKATAQSFPQQDWHLAGLRTHTPKHLGEGDYLASLEAKRQTFLLVKQRAKWYGAGDVIAGAPKNVVEELATRDPADTAPGRFWMTTRTGERQLVLCHGTCAEVLKPQTVALDEGTANQMAETPVGGVGPSPEGGTDGPAPSAPSSPASPTPHMVAPDTPNPEGTVAPEALVPDVLVPDPLDPDALDNAGNTVPSVPPATPAPPTAPAPAQEFTVRLIDQDGQPRAWPQNTIFGFKDNCRISTSIKADDPSELILPRTVSVYRDCLYALMPSGTTLFPDQGTGGDDGDTVVTFRYSGLIDLADLSIRLVDGAARPGQCILTLQHEPRDRPELPQQYELVEGASQGADQFFQLKTDGPVEVDPGMVSLIMQPQDLCRVTSPDFALEPGQSDVTAEFIVDRPAFHVFLNFGTTGGWTGGGDGSAAVTNALYTAAGDLIDKSITHQFKLYPYLGDGVRQAEPLAEFTTREQLGPPDAMAVRNAASNQPRIEYNGTQLQQFVDGLDIDTEVSRTYPAAALVMLNVQSPMAGGIPGGTAPRTCDELRSSLYGRQLLPGPEPGELISKALIVSVDASDSAGPGYALFSNAEPLGDVLGDPNAALTPFIRACPSESAYGPRTVIAIRNSNFRDWGGTIEANFTDVLKALFLHLASPHATSDAE